MKRPMDLFREARQRSLVQPYIAKFKRGDVVMNKAYGVISLVVNVHFGDEYRVIGKDFKKIENSAIQYELKDIKNEHTQKDINKKPSRFKECTVIDKFYEQVNPEMARLLYGVN